MSEQRVLIVDDNHALRRGLGVLMQSEGHEAVLASSLTEAFERLGDAPSHLLLDMDLPDGHGTSLLRHIRAEQLAIKVGVLTGTENAAILAELVTLRPDAFFKKPPDFDALLEWVTVPR